MKTTLVYLVGFMGAGKTCVGRRLAELLNWTFLDLDSEIEKRERVSIREIFKLQGEPRFREIETEELERASRMTEAVVALGGGAFCSDGNQEIVRRTGLSVWLSAPVERLYARCIGNAVRPLLTTREEMEALLRHRIPFYRKADYQLDVADRPAAAA